MSDAVGTGATDRAEPRLSVRCRVGAGLEPDARRLRDLIARCGIDNALIPACVDASQSAWDELRSTVEEGTVLIAPVSARWGAWVDVVACGRPRAGSSAREASVVVVPERSAEPSVWRVASRRITIDVQRRTPTMGVACAHFSHPDERTSGDGVWLDSQGDALRVVMIDVLGHGPRAAGVCAALLERVRSTSTMDPAQLVRALHGTAEAASRGAAMSVLDLSPRGEGTYVAVGNVEMSPLGRGPWMPAQPGTVGLVLPRLRAERFVLEPGSGVVMHTDGLVLRPEVGATIGNVPEPATLALLLATARWRSDDVAVVVVRRPS